MLAEFIKLPKEGETIGPYLLRQRLSTSILGSFFKAMHKGLHEEVMVHIIPEALHRADPGFMAKYKEEIARQKELPVGPALAAVEITRSEGNLLVRYEGGQYRSLNDLILKKKDLLSEERVQEILFAMAKGLGAAAKINQGHFFMTPDFLFLNEDGELRIAGIGLFQSIQYESFERFVSGTLVPISVDKSKSFSSLEILSPEIRNFKTRDQRSDFFCIGMCAYFLLLAKKPERRWDLPSKIRNDIGEGWDLFISNCLEPRPVDRFPNYRAFTRDLEHLDDLIGTPHREGGRLLRTLNKVPLPRSIENALGLQTLMFLRIGLLVLCGFLAVGTAALLKHILISDLGSDDSTRRIRQVTDPGKANIILDIDPDRAMVQVSGREQGRFVIQDGSLLLRGSSGRYKIVTSSPKRMPRIFDIEISSSNPIEQKVMLPYDFASVHFSGMVGTEIFIEESSGLQLHVGSIESDGGLLMQKRLLTGTYTFVAVHENYETAALEAQQIGRTMKSIQFEQVAKPTSLGLVSSPEGAAVYINDDYLGDTPLMVEGLDIGIVMKLRIEKPGYRPLIEEIEFATGQSIRIDTGVLALKEGVLSYNLDLSMTNAPDLRELALSINGQLKKVELEGQIVLPAGTHLIKLEHPDYFPVENRILLEDEQSVSLNLVLDPRPVRLTPMIGREDLSARYLVDGEVTPLKGNGYLPLPANSTVTVEAVVRDHMSVVQTFMGRPNDRIAWTVPLRPIPGPVLESSWKLPYFSIPMSWIAPGRYTMGSPVEENRRIPNEDNSTDAHFDRGFWIAQYEISQSVYRQIAGESPSHFSGDDLPVESVNWEQAMEFCRRLTEFERRGGRLPEGYVYRLPTEAEWEYAARAGTETPFSFGSLANPSMGNFQGSYSPERTEGDSPDNRYGTLPIGSFEANDWGLFDVHGNVAEWTLDLFWDRHPGGSETNPYNDEKGRGHPLRGGSWEDSAHRVRSASRSGIPASSRRNSIGFRIVLSRDFAH